jgi:Glucose / Sorbosone dehydrogenase
MTVILAFELGSGLLGQAPPQKIVPPPAAASPLAIVLEPVGEMPVHVNPAAPVVAGKDLLLIDQAGSLFRWDGERAHEVLTSKTAPSALRLIGTERLMNVAANAAGSKIYAVFLSTTVPKGTKQLPSRRVDSDAWYVVYEFTLAAGTLKEERPVVAMAVRTEGHTGGGLVMADDRTLLFSPGDNGDSYEDGRTEAQSLSNHVSKILRIDVATADVAPVAVGVRNCQRLVIYGQGAQARLVFVDPGGWVAEELNSVLVRELVGAATPLNFGWGRAAVDGRSREGSFFIDPLGNAVARIPADEAGFVKPVAEVGRERAPSFALAGPVSSPSFQSITALVADLVGGDVFGTTRPLGERNQPVYRVAVKDATGAATTFLQVSGGKRADARFFNFPDGSAGVLFERTGRFYRVSEAGPK